MPLPIETVRVDVGEEGRERLRGEGREDVSWEEPALGRGRGSTRVREVEVRGHAGAARRQEDAVRGEGQGRGGRWGVVGQEPPAPDVAVGEQACGDFVC